MELHHPVSGAVDADLADDVQDNILGVNSGRELAIDVETDRFRLAEGADSLENADFQVSGPDAGGKCAESTVGAGMGVSHDDCVAGPDEAALGEQGVADAVGAHVEKVFYAVAACPVAQDLCLRSCLGVFAGSDMIDNGFNSGGVKNTVLVAPNQVIDGNGGGDFVAEDNVQPEHFCAGERLIDKVCFKDFFSSGFSHIYTSLNAMFSICSRIKE